MHSLALLGHTGLTTITPLRGSYSLKNMGQLTEAVDNFSVGFRNRQLQNHQFRNRQFQNHQFGNRQFRNRRF